MPAGEIEITRDDFGAKIIFLSSVFIFLCVLCLFYDPSLVLLTL